MGEARGSIGKARGSIGKPRGSEWKTMGKQTEQVSTERTFLFFQGDQKITTQ